MGIANFYRAMNTDVGAAVYNAILKEKSKAIDTIYDNKHKNGTSSYYNVLSLIVSIWSKRVSEYEYYSEDLKFINRGIKYVRTGIGR